MQTNSKRHWEQRSELRRLSSAIFTLLDEHSVVQIGFLPRSFLDEFVSGCYFLIDLLETTPPAVLDTLATCQRVQDVPGLKDLNPTARRLCQLSRDLLFSLEADCISPQLIASIQRLFSLSASLIPETEDSVLRDYRQHIATREFKVAPAHADA